MKDVRLSDGSLENLATFLNHYGSNPEGWPGKLCCPDCGAAMKPKVSPYLVKQATISQGVPDEQALVMLEALAQRNPEYLKDENYHKFGTFEHAGIDKERERDCLSEVNLEFLAAHPLPTRFTYLFDLARDYRVRDRVEEVLNDSDIRAKNDVALKRLLREARPMNCLKQPNMRKLLSLPMLEHRPTALPLLLAVMHGKFDYTGGNGKRHKVFYGMDLGAKNQAEYVNFDGEIIMGAVPQHIQLFFADSMNLVTAVKKIDFPVMNTQVVERPRTPVVAMPAQVAARL